MQFNTPILFIIFNRPDVTNIVFERIREIKPKELFIAADGPRNGKIGEKEKCKEARSIINKIDWECDIKTLFQDQNKGCGLGVSEAITWFFDNVEQGIILEDDILPSISFFRFCEELLDKYKHDHDVSSISGTNSLGSTYSNANESYFFSEYVGCWGWASWRRAWQGYDYEISSWASKSVKKKFKKRFKTEQFLFLSDIFDSVCNQNIPNTWDFQWLYKRLLNNSLGIIPSVNLVKNIGFNSDATHTFDADEKIKNAKAEEIKFPLVYPSSKKVNTAFDETLASEEFSKQKISKATLIKNRLRFLKYRLSLKFNF